MMKQCYIEESLYFDMGNPQESFPNQESEEVFRNPETSQNDQSEVILEDTRKNASTVLNHDGFKQSIEHHWHKSDNPFIQLACQVLARAFELSAISSDGIATLAKQYRENPDTTKELAEIIFKKLHSQLDGLIMELFPGEKKDDTSEAVRIFMDANRGKASEDELIISYLTQLSNALLHMIAYGYEPVNGAVFTASDPQQKSAILFTQFGSMVTISPNRASAFDILYHRISRRDKANPETVITTEAFSSQDHFANTRNNRWELAGNQTQTGKKFSRTMIMGIKSSPITQEESEQLKMSMSDSSKFFAQQNPDTPKNPRRRSGKKHVPSDVIRVVSQQP